MINCTAEKRKETAGLYSYNSLSRIVVRREMCRKHIMRKFSGVFCWALRRLGLTQALESQRRKGSLFFLYHSYSTVEFWIGQMMLIGLLEQQRWQFFLQIFIFFSVANHKFKLMPLCWLITDHGQTHISHFHLYTRVNPETQAVPQAITAGLNIFLFGFCGLSLQVSMSWMVYCWGAKVSIDIRVLTSCYSDTGSNDFSWGWNKHKWIM